MKIKMYQFSLENGWKLGEPSFEDSQQTLIIAFGSKLLFEKSNLQLKVSKSHLIGCSTSGEIFEDTFNEETLSVSVLEFKNTPLKSVTVDCENINSFDAGKKIGETLKSPDLKSIFILSEGINVNGSHLVEGINSTVSKKVKITGGLAGDGAKFQNTYIYSNTKIGSQQIRAIGFYGNKIQVRHGSFGGWDIFGLERKITKSHENELFEIDGKSALDLYKEYLGEKAKDLPLSGLFYPLQIRANDKDINPVVRTILSVNEERKSMIFAGNVPEGYLAQLMSANFDRIIDGAEKASEQLDLENDKNPKFCIAISCVGRRLILGERVDEEIASVFGKLPLGSHLIGFYSYGEISPSQNGEKCSLHNQTMTVTSIDELD